MYGDETMKKIRKENCYYRSIFKKEKDHRLSLRRDMPGTKRKYF